MSTPIYTASDLANIANDYPSGDYVQMANIDLTGIGWTPLNNFTGSYDGNGFTISNLTVPLTQNAGLFGSTTDASLTRIVLLKCNVSGNSVAGCLAGEVDGGSVTKCYAEGIASFFHPLSHTSVGGLIGTLNGSDAGSTTVEDCAFAPFLTPCSVQGYVVGGLIGTVLQSTYGDFVNITNCYAASTVTCPSSYHGGLVGLFGAGATGITITSSYYDETISGQSDTGKGTPEPTSAMMEQATYSGWDFTNIWQITPLAGGDFGYPYFNWMVAGPPPVQCKATQVLIDARSGQPMIIL